MPRAVALLVATLVSACAGPPAFGEDGAITIDETSGHRIAFSWPAIAEGSVSAYVVSVDWQNVARLDPDVRQYAAEELPEGTEHTLAVLAVDDQGRESTRLEATATTADETAPTFAPSEDGITGSLSPIDVRIDPLAEGAAADAPRTVHLSWPSAEDTVGVASYRVLRDGEEIGTVDAPATELTLTDVAWSAPTDLEVRARDAAGNESDPGLRMRWQPTTPSFGMPEHARDSVRAAVEAARVEQLLLGALGGDAFGDVFSSSTDLRNIEEAMATAEGAGVADSAGSLSRQRGRDETDGRGAMGVLVTRPPAPATGTAAPIAVPPPVEATPAP
ncbi:MAG: hypothetical protein AB7S26_36875 [Sandaracinaceae bacterium]